MNALTLGATLELSSLSPSGERATHSVLSVSSVPPCSAGRITAP